MYTNKILGVNRIPKKCNPYRIAKETIQPRTGVKVLSIHQFKDFYINEMEKLKASNWVPDESMNVEEQFNFYIDFMLIYDLLNINDIKYVEYYKEYDTFINNLFDKLK